jgi:hypothetical protein
MALGSTQPQIEISARNLPGGKGRPARGADNLTAVCELIVWKMWDPRRLTTLWAFTACYRDRFTFYYNFICCFIWAAGHFTVTLREEQQIQGIQDVKFHIVDFWIMTLSSLVAG